MFPSWLHEFDPSFWSPVRRTSAPSPLLRPRRRVEQQLLQLPALEQAPIEDLPPALVAVDRQSQPSSVAAGRRSIPITYLGYTDPAQSLDFKVKRREQRQLRRAAAGVPAEAAYSDDTHAESENDDDHEGQADAVEHARHAVKPITREPAAGATNEPESSVDDAVSRCLPAGGLAAFDSSLRRHLGLRIVPVYPDGNCLFSSAAMQLYGDPAQYRRVREAVCAYMRGDIPSIGPSPRQQAMATKGRTVLVTDPIPVRRAAAVDPAAVARSADARQQTRSFFQRLISLESGVEDVDIDTYCDEYMGRDGSWGGYPELVALEEWSDRPVEIFTLPRDPCPSTAALHASEDGAASNAAGGASQSQSVAGRIGSAILSAASTAAGAAGGIAAAAMSMASGSASAGGKGRESMSVQTVDGDIRAASGSACCDGGTGQPPQMPTSTSTSAGGDGGGPNSGGSLTGEPEWPESQCAPKSIHFAGELPTEQLQGVEPLRFCYSSGNHYDAVMPVSDLQVLAEYQDPEQCYADDDAWDAMMTVDDEDDVDGGGQQAEGQQRKVMAGIYMLPRPAAAGAGGAGDGGSQGPGGSASVLRRVPITGGGDDDDYIDKEELRDAFEHEAPPLLPAHSAASGTRWIRYRVVAAPPRPSMAIRASRLQRVAATATPAANQPQQCVASTASGVLPSPIEL